MCNILKHSQTSVARLLLLAGVAPRLVRRPVGVLGLGVALGPHVAALRGEVRQPDPVEEVVDEELVHLLLLLPGVHLGQVAAVPPAVLIRGPRVTLLTTVSWVACLLGAEPRHLVQGDEVAGVPSLEPARLIGTLGSRGRYHHRAEEHGGGFGEHSADTD